MGSAARAGRSRSADGQVVGALLLIVGVGWILRQTGVVQLSVESTLSALLIVLGFGLVVTARNRGGRGLFWLGAGLIVALASTSSLDLGSLKTHVGDRRFVPASVGDIRPYDTAIGDVVIDLTHLTAFEATRQIHGKVVVGDLRVFVPNEVPVRIDARTGAGTIKVFGEQAHDDFSVKWHRRYNRYDTASGERLSIQLEVAVGNIEVVRGSP